jgi:hypothetical protein
VYLLIGLIGASVWLGLKVCMIGNAAPTIDWFWPKSLGTWLLQVLFWPVYVVHFFIKAIRDQA